MDANELWHILIPVQILGLIANITVGVLLGMYAKKRGAGQGVGEIIETGEKAQKEEEALRRTKLLIVNLLLTVALLAVLSSGIVTSYVAFMVALALALAINYPDLKLQDKLIKKHAPAALIISATLFAAGAMVGIFNCTEMLTAMANVIIGIVPSWESTCTSSLAFLRCPWVCALAPTLSSTALCRWSLRWAPPTASRP